MYLRRKSDEEKIRWMRRHLSRGCVVGTLILIVTLDATGWIDYFVRLAA